MKDRKSKILRGVIAELDKPPRPLRHMLKLEYPYDFREAVFCWLWANHTEVTNLRTRWDYVTWVGIAAFMREDGVLGHNGQPPTANAVRRVWGRVCRGIEAKEAGLPRPDGRRRPR